MSWPATPVGYSAERPRQLREPRNRQGGGRGLHRQQKPRPTARTVAFAGRRCRGNPNYASIGDRRVVRCSQGAGCDETRNDPQGHRRATAAPRAQPARGTREPTTVGSGGCPPRPARCCGRGRAREITDNSESCASGTRTAGNAAQDGPRGAGTSSDRQRSRATCRRGVQRAGSHRHGSRDRRRTCTAPAKNATGHRGNGPVGEGCLLDTSELLRPTQRKLHSAWATLHGWKTMSRPPWPSSSPRSVRRAPSMPQRVRGQGGAMRGRRLDRTW